MLLQLALQPVADREQLIGPPVGAAGQPFFVRQQVLAGREDPDQRVGGRKATVVLARRSHPF